MSSSLFDMGLAARGLSALILRQEMMKVGILVYKIKVDLLLI